MTKIYYNARFKTMDDACPQVTAVAVRDGKIAQVGDRMSLTEQAEAAGEGVELCDMDGMTVFPGFIDLVSAAAFDAFDQAVKEEYVHPDDAAVWVKSAVEFIIDKGAALIAVHGPADKAGSLFRQCLQVLDFSDESFIYDVDYQTELEKDSGPYYFEAILGDPNQTFLLFNPVYDMYETVHDCMKALTCEAAEHLGLSDRLGTIAPGKDATFTVFDENPFASGMRNFSRLHAVQVYRKGELVYDVDNQSMSDMYDMMITQIM